MNKLLVQKSPMIRFNNFTEGWQTNLLGYFSRKIKNKNKDFLVQNIVSNSAQYGLVSQMEFFDRNIANSANIDGYYVIKKGDFVYNPRISKEAPYGPVNLYKLDEKGVVSPLYLCFEVEGIDKEFLSYYFKSNCWHRYVYINGDQGARHDRVNIKDTDFFKMPISYPSLLEQRKIAEFFTLLDYRIEKQKEKIAIFRQKKRGIYQKIFNQEIQFKDENGKEFPKWEMKSIGEIFEERSERGNAELPLLAVTIDTGVIKKEGSALRDNSSNNKDSYKIVQENDIAYNSMRMWQGASGRSSFNGIVSPAYTVLNPKLGISSLYFSYLFKTKFMMQLFQRFSQGLTSDTWNLKYPSLSKIKVNVPSYKEQQKIAAFLSEIDMKIQKEEKKLACLKLQKKGFMQKIFV